MAGKKLETRYPVNGQVDTQTAGPGSMYVWEEGDASGAPIGIAHDENGVVDVFDGCVPENQRNLPPIILQAGVFGVEGNRTVGSVEDGDEEVRVTAVQRPVGVGFYVPKTGGVGVRPMPETRVGGRIHVHDFPEMPVGEYLSEVGDDAQRSAARWSGGRLTPETVVYLVGSEGGIPRDVEAGVQARGGDSNRLIDAGEKVARLREAREARYKQYNNGD